MPPVIVQWWAFGVMGVVLVIASITDVHRGVVPKTLTYPTIVLALVGHTFFGGLTGDSGMQLGLVGSLAGFATGFVPMLIIFLTGGIGGGDVKLMGAIGALGGWKFVLLALFLGLMVAVVMAIVLIIRKGIVKRTLGRMGLWFWVVLSNAKPTDPATADSPKLPFALALCIGSAVALADALLG
ncbi:MAG TPA: prepilin peptidase, partial [Phycisphaerae bacterium]|nr:prepilin peptidase [Phycisphaerae bacterium]